MRPRPNRHELIDKISSGLADHDFVLAAWLEGADAQGHVDEFSDIDLWLEVEDGREQDGLSVVREVLESIATLDLAVEVVHPHPLIRQAFYRPGVVTNFPVVDTCVQSHRREFHFRKGVEDEQVLVLFDLGGVLRFEELDEEGMRAENHRRVTDLECRLPLAETWVRKELARGRFLDALGAYHRYIMEPLVEALRIRHSPTKADFYLKHVGLDLPPDKIGRLEELYRVGGLEELEGRLPDAVGWLRAALIEAHATISPATSGTVAPPGEAGIQE